MPITGGFTGKTLRVDLTTRTVTVEDTLTKYKKYWGGTAMAYKVMWDEVPPSVKPWDPENRIIFGWGPLVGTSAPCAGRCSVTSLWPGHPKNAVATGHMGGHFSAEAKFAGWDGIIVQGKASGPVYIAIRDDKVDIVDCPKLWGQGIYLATAEITEAMGSTCQVAAIGPAGENLVPQSNVMTGVSHSAGVCGSIMGSKNLKAIAVVGTGGVKVAADKKVWRALIDNCLALMGSTYQHVIPETPQPWSDYYASGSWWKAAPKRYWGAADPPIETGVSDPHDVHKMAYRTLIPTRYMTAVGEDYCVRMDGCFGCPLQCHIASHVPSAEKWGTSPYVDNTCVGMFLANFIPAANYTSNLSADEARIRQVEARAVGIHVGDDMGMWTHYSQAQKNWAFAYGTDKGVTRIKPNIPLAEWTDLNKAGGLFRMYDVADLGFIQEYGRRVAYKVGEFGKALGDNVVDWIKRWNLEDAYNNDASVAHWGGGAPAHHNTAQIGSLYNSFYNRDPMNHSWTNWTGGGLPVAVMANIVEQTMKPWYGPGMGAAVDTYVAAAGPYVPMNHAKAVVAKFVLNRTELHNDLGICDWSYPWWASPLKERGLLGDLSVEAKLYSAATGETKTMPELDLDSERASTLHRALIVRRYGSMQIRAEHDQLPPWAAADLKAEWNTILDQWYEELGYDKATGTPTAATYHRLGMDDVADELQSLGLLPATV